MAAGTEQPKIGDSMTFQQKKEFIEKLSFFPALMIAVFIRRKLGFRMLKPVWLTTMGWVLVFVFVFYKATAEPFPILLVLFAGAMVAIGLFERYRRWCDLCNGVRWHSYSPGVSYLERLPLPSFIRSHRRIYRFLDPIMCFLIGIAVTFLSHALGGVITLCAVCLAIYENALFERMLEHDLDTLDGLIAAEVQGETAKRFEGPQPDEKQRNLEDTAGIPTGIAPDIHKQVEGRRRKRALAELDNLATEPAKSPA